MQQDALTNYEDTIETNVASKETILQPWEEYDEKAMYRQSLKQEMENDEKILSTFEKKDEQYDYDENAMNDRRLTEKYILTDMLSKYPEQEGRKYDYIKKCRESSRVGLPFSTMTMNKK